MLLQNARERGGGGNQLDLLDVENLSVLSVISALNVLDVLSVLIDVKYLYISR